MNEKKDQDRSGLPETVDLTRRKLVSGATKAVWVAPTLSVLSFAANAQTEPPPPPSDPLGESASPGTEAGKARTKSRVKSRKKDKKEGE